MFNCVLEPSALTKHVFLSEIFCIINPLGFLVPIVVSFKFLLRYLWRLKVDWDNVVPEEIGKRYCLMREGLQQIHHLRIPQFISTMLGAEFHMFCDDSEKGYGTVIYIRSTDPSGAIVVCLLGAKSCVALFYFNSTSRDVGCSIRC